MFFSKGNIYNSALVSIGTNVLIKSQGLDASDEEMALFIDFFNTIKTEIDSQQQGPVEILIPYEFQPWLEMLDDEMRACISLRIPSNQLDSVDTEKHKIVVEMSEAGDASHINGHVQAVIIANENIKQFEDLIPSLNDKYDLIIVNVPSHSELNRLKTLGIEYFEGEFIEKPEKLNQSQIPANKVSVLNLISTLNDPQSELDDIARVITADNILSYKLLRIVNSPIFRGMSEISTIQEAIVRFGFANLKKWVLMLSLCNVSDKPKALVKIALQRAIMCSKYSEYTESEDNPEICYTAGLLSTLDAFVDHPLEYLLRETALSDEVTQGILNHEGALGEVLQKVIAYQRGEGTIKDKVLTLIYIESAKEANEIFSVLGMS